MSKYIINKSRPSNSQSSIQIDTPAGTRNLDTYDVSEFGMLMSRRSPVWHPTTAINGAQPSNDVFVPGSLRSNLQQQASNTEPSTFDDTAYKLKIIKVPDIHQTGGTCTLSTKLAGLGGVLSSTGVIPEGYELDTTAFLRCNNLSHNGEFDGKSIDYGDSGRKYAYSTLDKLKRYVEEDRCFKIPIMKSNPNCKQTQKDDQVWGSECCATKSVGFTIKRLDDWLYPTFDNVMKEIDSGTPIHFSIGDGRNGYVPPAPYEIPIKLSLLIFNTNLSSDEERQLQQDLLKTDLTGQEIVDFMNRLDVGFGTLSLDSFPDKYIQALYDIRFKSRTTMGHAILLHGYKYDPSDDRITLYIKNSWTSPANITLSFDKSEVDKYMPFISIMDAKSFLVYEGVDPHLTYGIKPCTSPISPDVCDEVNVCSMYCYDCIDSKIQKVNVNTDDATEYDVFYRETWMYYTDSYIHKKCFDERGLHPNSYRAYLSCPERTCYGCPNGDQPPYDPDKLETGCVEHKISWECQKKQGFERYCSGLTNCDKAKMVDEDFDFCVKRRKLDQEKDENDREFSCYNSIKILEHLIP